MIVNKHHYEDLGKHTLWVRNTVAEKLKVGPVSGFADRTQMQTGKIGLFI